MYNAIFATMMKYYGPPLTEPLFSFPSDVLLVNVCLYVCLTKHHFYVCLTKHHLYVCLTKHHAMKRCCGVDCLSRHE